MRSLAGLPKAHLHVHLENAVRWTTLRELAAAHDIEVDPVERYQGFAHFAEQSALIRACLHEHADFRRVALEFCADEAEQGTRYAELTFTAAAHGERVGQAERPLEAVLEGLAEGRERYGIEVRLILDHSRRRPVERAWQTLALAQRYAGEGVVAVGLAGDESYPLEPFARVFDAAREAGVHVVHHAGEMSGAPSIRQAIAAHSERLGHGIRVLDEPDLVAEVRGLGLALEVCPSSNVALGFAPSLPEHPLPRLVEAGLAVTLSTDIPSALGGLTLTQELERVRSAFGYSDGELARFNLNAVEASFAPEPVKDRLREATEGWLAS